MPQLTGVSNVLSVSEAANSVRVAGCDVHHTPQFLHVQSPHSAWKKYPKFWVSFLSRAVIAILLSMKKHDIDQKIGSAYVLLNIP